MSAKLLAFLSNPAENGGLSADAVGTHFFPAALALWCGLIAFGQFSQVGSISAGVQTNTPGVTAVQPVSNVMTGGLASSVSSRSGTEGAGPSVRPHLVALNDPLTAQPVAPAPAVTGARPLRLGAGDQLKIAVYERMEIDEDKWASASDRAKQPSAQLQMRTELTGDYSVQEDGTVSLPLLGVFHAGDSTMEELRDEIASVYTATLGRSSIVNVRLADRLPIYVLGPVKNSGLYKYSAGMTVWHAVALAGGFEQGERPAGYLDSRVEATREIGNVRRNNDRVAPLVARRDVLVAQRDKRSAAASAELLELAGRDRAAALIAGEVSARSLAEGALEARGVSIRAGLQAAKSELDAARHRISLIDMTINTQDERLRTLKTLAANGNVKRPQLLEAEMQLSQTRERREEARIGSSQAEHRIAQAQQDLSRLNSDAALELENQISLIERELDDVKGQRHSGMDVLEVLQSEEARSRPAAANIDELVQYEIVRRADGQSITIAAKGDAELQPGDLVKLTLPRMSNPRPAL